MSLPDDDKDAVECMIQWLYTKKLRLTTTFSMETSHLCYMELAKLNALAEKYDICSLRNDIIDGFYNFSKFKLDGNRFAAPYIDSVTYVYNTTSKRSPLRKLLVACYAYNIDFGWFEKDTTKGRLAEVSPDFAAGLAIELVLRLKYQGRKSPLTRPSKDFHESLPIEPDKECP